MKIRITTLFTLLLLTACSSTSERIRHYSLLLNAEYPKKTKIVEEKTRILIGPVALANFLDKEGLALQVGSHEIQIAHYHRWAEPLENAIPRLLIKEMSSTENGFTFEQQAGRWNHESRYRLRLEFDKFHATDAASVVIGGRYWFYGNSNKLLMDKNFMIIKILIEDGYLSSVGQLKEATTELANQIIEELSKLSLED